MIVSPYGILVYDFVNIAKGPQVYRSLQEICYEGDAGVSLIFKVYEVESRRLNFPKKGMFNKESFLAYCHL